MKQLKSLFVAIVILVSMTGKTPAFAAAQQTTIPTFSIVTIVPNTSITILTFNFPSMDSFDVLMGPMGTQGVNGIKAGTISSGSGGSFSGTFKIPASLKNYYQIAVRLQSNTGSGYFAYNWFYNDMSGTLPAQPGPGTGATAPDRNIPVFSITNIVPNQTVTILTSNFPKNDRFDVLMGLMGTRGVNGIKVDNISSGNGGQLTFTFTIPAALQDQPQIAIRLQSSSSSGYYAYNWFYNQIWGDSGGTGGIIPGYAGYPIFSIASVKQNQTVTIVTYNLPPNDRFKVFMGPIGTRGINGYPVTTIDSGSGGQQTLTFNIPLQLHGSYQISIRLQSITGSGYYAYNWFYNNNA